MNVPADNGIEENTCVIEVDHIQSPLPDVTRSRSSCPDLFLPNANGIHLSIIPKTITTFDEKYVLHCLELLRNYTLRAAAVSNFASKAQIICPHVMAKPTIVTGSQSMINILNSPSLQKFRSTDFDINFRVRNLLDPVYSDILNPPHELSNSSKPENEVVVLNRKNSYPCPPGHTRASSISSTYTSFSDKSSSLASASLFQGMLQCKWKDGAPYFVFLVDDKPEVYAATLSKVEPSGDKGSDYIYTFCSRMKGKKKHDDQELDLQSLCTMKVSTSITLCPNSSSEVKESRFVLSLSCGDHYIDELQISNNHRKKSQRLVSKVAKVFKSSQSYKKRPSLKFCGSSAIFEDSTWDPYESMESKSETSDYMHNLEVAAIIVKDTFKNCKSKGDSIGGWGLKFLKKSGKESSLKMISPFDECSTSLDVLIPAGIHGGPKTGGGGPTSLVERWVSGGACDCGGWDLGCPLTVLNLGPIGANSLSLVDNFGEVKFVDLLVQGSKQDAPIFKMANIREGLYCIHFQSTLSTLQSFAIAAAIIHSRSPDPRSKVYRM